MSTERPLFVKSLGGEFVERESPTRKTANSRGDKE